MNLVIEHFSWPLSLLLFCQAYFQSANGIHNTFKKAHVSMNFTKKMSITANAIHDTYMKEQVLAKVTKKMPTSFKLNVTQARIRRQMKPRNRDKETIYEPYWPGAEYYLKRTRRTRRRQRTRPPPPTTQSLSPTAPSTTAGSTDFSRTTAYIDYNCQHPCPLIYEHFGVVCGQRFNGITLEMREFYDACELFDANCVNHIVNSKHRGPWYIVYRGVCHEHYTPFVYNPTNVTEIIARLDIYMKRVSDNNPFHATRAKKITKRKAT